MRWIRGSDGDMVESAITLPVMMLLALALVNLALAGYASVTATSAASYAARIGAVTQSNPAGQAMSAAQDVLRAGVGNYHVSVRADRNPGGKVVVRVQWEVPNLFGSLMPLFGASSGPLRGEAVSSQRKEGW